MRRYGSSGWLVLAACLLCRGMHAQGEFPGQYAVSGTVKTRHVVHATLTIGLTNRSGKDLPAARLLLRGGLPSGGEQTLDAFLTIPDRSRRTIRAEISLAARELRRWEHGAAPGIWLEFLDESGQRHSYSLHLIRTARVPEGQ